MMKNKRNKKLNRKVIRINIKLFILRKKMMKKKKNKKKSRLSIRMIFVQSFNKDQWIRNKQMKHLNKYQLKLKIIVNVY